MRTHHTKSLLSHATPPHALKSGSATLVMGAQFGDEGKGKLVDVLALEADLVCRMQGGNNAGHTIWVGDQKVVTHLLPSGILRDHCQVAIGAGVVVDLGVLYQEMMQIQEKGFNIDPNRFSIDPRCHLILPYHKECDGKKESARKSAIGTTGRGIGPTYASRAYREGPRLGDLIHPASWERVVAGQPALFEGLSVQDMQKFAQWATFFRPYVKDVAMKACNALSSQQKVLLEGAQGAMLDLSFGTYPFVTSSPLIAGSCPGGLGIPPHQVKQICGVFKAYATRVGNGPFPGELQGELAEFLRQKGNEFGSTTGRPRRVGWLDLVQLKYLARLNGFTSLALMKSDVLEGMDHVGIITSYRDSRTSQTMPGFPSTLEAFESVQPVVEFMEPWSHTHQTSPSKLHPAFSQFIARIEDEVGVPIVYVSSGPARDQGLWLHDFL